MSFDRESTVPRVPKISGFAMLKTGLKLEITCTSTFVMLIVNIDRIAKFALFSEATEFFKKLLFKI